MRFTPPQLQKLDIPEEDIAGLRFEALEKFNNGQGIVSSFFKSTARGLVSTGTSAVEGLGAMAGSGTIEQLGADATQSVEDTFNINQEYGKTNFVGNALGIAFDVVLLSALIFRRKAVVVAVRNWRKLVPRRSMTLKGKGPQGIGGCLAWFCFILIVSGPFLTLTISAGEWKSIKNILPPDLESLVIIPRMVIPGCFSIYGIWVGIMLFKRHPHGKIWAQRFLFHRLVAMVLLNLFIWVQCRGEPGKAASFLSDHAGAGVVAEIGFFLVWGLYLKRSRRVQNTFPGVTVPSDDLSEPAERIPQSPSADLTPDFDFTPASAVSSDTLIGYGLLAQELETGKRLESLWLMAVAENAGDEVLAQAFYNRERATMLKSEYQRSRTQSQ